MRSRREQKSTAGSDVKLRATAAAAVVVVVVLVKLELCSARVGRRSSVPSDTRRPTLKMTLTKKTMKKQAKTVAAALCRANAGDDGGLLVGDLMHVDEKFSVVAYCFARPYAFVPSFLLAGFAYMPG